MENTYHITPPVIHLNGTGRETLAKDYEAAADALNAFKEAWSKIEFNSRDYYVMGLEKWDQAVAHRCQMNAKIQEISYYIEAHQVAIQEQTK